MTKPIIKQALAVIVCTMTTLGVAAADKTDVNFSLASGVEAYRAGEYSKAWKLLHPIADAGDAKAQRYAGKILLAANRPELLAGDVPSGVDYLAKAALAGDYVALVELENLRRDGGESAPSIEQIIEIEESLAKEGDPVTAWRLAKRFETGDGVSSSPENMVKWLEVAASASIDRFPKAREAAFRLCEAYTLVVREKTLAERWCQKAASEGHAGAAILLRRVARAQG
ncbi:hypothetical protein PUV54_04315 [Hyphococcus flavus]|uniref:Sel1 repeat family protein n=1 Tax=Hyphococcus flavus TaxID=1866326 RepID=A0AAE9ZGN4_9PROT|nr:hypothetical protein [Hyphococcus flavus]WDI32417.1 hypothetical protein PUV54_04315 [Hyphococcus flavus]